MLHLGRAMGLLAAIAVSALAHGGEIPVTIDFPLPDARPAAPVRFGTPFPPGVFQLQDKIQVVDDRQQLVPHQQHVTATWDPAGDQGVRWLLVDFLADPQRQYRIVYGDSLLPAFSDSTPIAKLGVGQIELDTGALRGAISTDCAELFSGLQRAGGTPLVMPQGEAFSAFYVEHETRGVFRSDLDPSPSVVLEESGPIRAVVKLDGWYTNAAGEQFCRFSIRAHFFRGRGDVRLDHTFIYTGVSKDDRIRAMGLQLPRRNGQRGHVWGEGDRQDDAVSLFTSSIKVVQDSPNHDQIELLEYPRDGGAPAKLAGRSLGSLAYDGVTLAIRDAWQQYPWGFAVHDGVIQAQLWPDGARLLDTSFDGYWWFLNEHQKRYMLGQKRGATKEPLDDWIARFRKITNATGAAKTHELWVTFDPTGYNGGRLLREVAHPVIACADPAWMTSTRALDFCAQTPRDDRNFGDEERYLDAVLAMMQTFTESRHWYGWWDWGGYHQHPGYPAGAFQDTHDLNTWHRYRPKSHYGWGQLPWLQYFRTGDRKWLRYAQTYTLYSADRAHVHHGNLKGFEYHYDHSDIPWMGGYVMPEGPELASNLQQKDDYVYMYWLTGDRRALDVLQTWGEAVRNVPPNHFNAYFKWKPGLERGNDIRNAGQQLHRLMMLYQATWDPRILKIAQGVADSMAIIDSEEQVILAEGDRGNPDPGQARFHAAGGWAYEGLWLYYQVTRDERIRKTLSAFIERSVNCDGGMGGGYGPIRAYTYGYELTGDTLYLDMIRAALDDVVAQGVTSRVLTPGQKFTTVTLPRALGTLASAPESWRQAKLPTDQRGRTLRYRYAAWTGNPTYTAAATACFLKTQDRAWRFRLLFNNGGQWIVLRPDGSTAYESPQTTRSWLEVQIPADGQTGVYTLRSLLEQKSQSMPQACVLRSDLPVSLVFPALTQSPGPLSDPTFPVKGRSFYFKPAHPEDRIHLVAATRQDFGLFLSDRLLASTAGRMHSYLGGHTFSLSTAAGQMLELRTLTPPDRFNQFRDGFFSQLKYLWFDHGASVVAGNAEDYFLPDALRE